MNTKKVNYIIETVACPLCGSDDFFTYMDSVKELYNGFDEYFSIVKCKSCSMIYTNPRPTVDTIDGFYPDTAGYYQPPNNIRKLTNINKYYQSTLTYFHGYDLKVHVPRILACIYEYYAKQKKLQNPVPDFLPQGKLLDVGCSYGGYLYQMKQLGWNVYGIEMNPQAVDYAVNVLRLKKVEKKQINEIDYPAESFDVVRMCMVLEHMHDPITVLKKINKITKVNGKLIIMVPNIDGFEISLYKELAYPVQVPQHLLHFSPYTVKKLLNACGFTVQYISHHNFDRDLVSSSGYMENKILSKLLHSRIIRMTIVRFFVWFLSRIGKTSRMTIVATKVI